MSTRQPPAYFASVRDRTRQRWDQIERDPELAGPWKQLFGQVQSPRHVVSELLQNADDAGARRVHVSLSNGQFVFEHDGKDFDKEEFASLCRFGFSNKRKLHTIGFRGVGFKSTFSLGETVEVLTPSLAVRFHKRRFTEPVWMDDAPPCDVTRIAVKVQDPNREKELRKNLQEWVESPASLLFFNCINELTIGDVTLCKCRIGPGPVAGSDKIRLTGRDQHDVVVFASPEEPFPQEAVDEIRQERNVEDLHLPPCRVELVVGLPGKQRLYVVLPTGVILATPFSCNAPFFQDPARSAIKPPSLSPTNRWLLHRLGRLAGKAMLEWLQDRSLEFADRAKAYCLLPQKPHEGDSLEADATSAICQGFAEAVGNQPVLLTTEGRLVDSEKCIAPPTRVYDVWTPAQLLEVFGDGDEHVLSKAVTDDHRQRLESWGWLDGRDKHGLIERLAGGRRIPRPAEDANILALWSIVQQSVRGDYGGHSRRRLAIVPVERADVLLPAENVVRLPAKKETINDEAWAFLGGLVRIVECDWLEFLDSQKGRRDRDTQASLQLLQDIGLDRASPTEAIVRNACRTLFARSDVTLEEHVRIAHLMAALDAGTPEEFRCITRDGQQRKPDDGIIATQDPSVEALLPEVWAAAHLLHDAYFREYSACTRQQWEEWVASQKSRFFPFVCLDKTRVFNSNNLQNEVREFVKSRGGNQSLQFYAQVQQVEVRDFGFPDTLKEFWDARAKEEPEVWAKVAERILASPSWYWENCLQASLKESNYSKTRPLGSPITSEWVAFLSSTTCLRDTQGRVLVPAELYLRTPETEPLLGVEPFVRAELDTEATKPLLRLLGVRDTPAGLDKLLDRIRALARATDPAPLLSEIVKWYGALDRALARCDAAGVKEVRQAFTNEPLVLTAAHGWAKASEVFQYASEGDLPDALVVHQAVNNLGMWSRLGVADRPTADLVLDWLKGLPSGQPLEPGAIPRVRDALKRYPTQVWQTCLHWLAFDNAWVPVERLRFRLTSHSLPEWLNLFPAVKAETADLQMLSADVCARQPFDALPDLGTAVEYRPTHRPGVLGVPAQKPWLAALARALARVKLDDEAKTQRVRQTAERLGRSAWQPFPDSDPIEVTPYVDGAPAGPPYSPDVLWYEQSIFVRDGGLARSFDALVDELARPFADDKEVTEAIKACIDRDEGFIAEYMEKHFTLEAESTSTGVSEEESRVGKGNAGGDVRKESEEAPVTVDGGEEAWREPDDSEEEQGMEDGAVDRPRRRKREPSLFERFALGGGYRWDAGRQRFVHPDGSWMERCESPFHWRRFDSAGDLVTRYWASQKCLARGGVEIAAELWELFRRSPAECSMILADGDGRPRELRGRDLLQMMKNKVIRLYPAKYRIREESEA